ncbi:MAG: M2 family metallopeptidase [Acidobacteriota bacterium]|nr:M2 family metallopeptidase [Acidobacteriota bacterium]
MTTTRRDRLRVSTLLVVAILPVATAACARPAGEADYPATAAGAEAFVAEVNRDLLEEAVGLARAQWVQATYITDDTDQLAAAANDRYLGKAMAHARSATRFDGLELDDEVARQLGKLKTGMALPAPSDDQERTELTRIAASLESTYGKAKYCPEGQGCRDLGELSNTMATSRDPDELLEAWIGWRTISPPMRADYRRFAELGNQGARELGFADLGALWRSNYDMPPEDFRAELDRLWEQVRPLYEPLHCYVRSKLNEAYGDEVAPAAGPIPAHLLGNMWAQTWTNIYPMLAPAGADPGFDVGELLARHGVDELEMVRYGERFFTSLGFAPLPDTFWQRSLFTKPADRDVVCHASAWDIDQVDDVRIKMCIERTEEDFSTIHHELGHSFYQRAYSGLAFLFRDSANDGFHEGVGDTVAMSVTPDYLVQVGLLDKAPAAAADLGGLLKMALDKIAFLPFGLLVDQWRWGVFSGEITPGEYNAAWWRLREKYQGVAAPVARTEADFDPGAKYHVPANTPYTRYFLADILQFQFQRSLCAAAGYDGPLHRCSIYGNKEAGERMIKMMAMGASRPWPDALEAVTGQRQMDATAIIDYFAPLQAWLEGQTESLSCGW